MTIHDDEHVVDATMAIEESHRIAKARTMPVQKPGLSKQDYGTDPRLIAAIEKRFGKIEWDLAATEQNKKAPKWLGPGSPAFSIQDSLAIDWRMLPLKDINKVLFLNPPFGRIAPWAKKCAETEWRVNQSLYFLVPASVGSNWFAQYVFGYAERVYFLQGRLIFEGETMPYPKDCMLCEYTCQTPASSEPTQFEVWNWHATLPPKEKPHAGR